MNKLEVINQYFDDAEIQTLSADGFDDAILGVNNVRIIYSISDCIKILVERDKMNIETAIEYFQFNVEGSYVGDRTPIWLDDTMFSDLYYWYENRNVI